MHKGVRRITVTHTESAKRAVGRFAARALIRHCQQLTSWELGGRGKAGVREALTWETGDGERWAS